MGNKNIVAKWEIEMDCIEKPSIEILEKIIKDSFEFEDGLKKPYGDYTLFQRAVSVIDFVSIDWDRILFLKIFIKVIEEYLKNGLIKVQDGRIFYCNTSLEINPNKKYKEIEISCPDEYMSPPDWFKNPVI